MPRAVSGKGDLIVRISKLMPLRPTTKELQGKMRPLWISMGGPERGAGRSRVYGLERSRENVVRKVDEM